MDTKIVIAAIVSTNANHCYTFLHHYKLNPKCFKIATSYEQLAGLDRRTPIIVTYCGDRHGLEYFEMMRLIDERFTNVRHMDY